MRLEVNWSFDVNKDGQIPMRNTCWRSVRLSVNLIALTMLLSGCQWRQSRPPGEQITTGPQLLEPVVPAGYQKISPAPIDDSAQMLAQTSTIFRGSLKSVQFTYDGCTGPRTNYVFSDSDSLMGDQVLSTVTLRVLGGPTPEGKW